MADEATPEIPVEVVTPEPVAAATAEKGLTPNERLMASRLPPEQAKIFREQRLAKKATVKEVIAEVGKDAKVPSGPAKAGTTKPKPAAAAAPADAPNAAEEIRFGEEPAKPNAGEQPNPADEEALELSAEDLAKLDEKARKRVTDASKENVKVRKRAQDAEAKVKEYEAKLAEHEKEMASLREGTTRGAGLSGNAFAQFKDGHAVAAWGTNAQEALVLIRNHERAVKAGKVHASETVTHTLPNGQEVELSAKDAATYEARAQHAQAWFEHDEQVTKNRESAEKLAEKHKDTKGYAEARAKYLKDPALPARLDELVAKAALYDTLESRKAVITFSDSPAGAAKSAPPTPAGGVPSTPAKPKQPPSETPASVPRLVKTDDADNELIARKSALMEQARTASDPGQRQKLLKQAIMLGNPQARRKKA
jgi:hypothetical protein